MKINPEKNTVTININDLRLVKANLLNTMKYMRNQACLPLDRYKPQGGMLSEYELAAIGLMDIAKSLNIDMGVDDTHDHHLLDLREV